MKPPSRIILTGFAGTGKSTVARLSAARLGWDWVDTDDLVEQAAGSTIPEIFAREGEPAFRRRESEALRTALVPERRVVATGGGAVLLAENRRVMAEAGLVVCLQVAAGTASARTRGGRRGRPLLAAPGGLRLQDERAAYYDRADWTVHADVLTAEQVAAEVVRTCELHGARLFRRAGRIEALVSADLPAPEFPDTREAAAFVRTPGGRYPVYVRWEGLQRLGEYMARLGLEGTAHVIADPAALAAHGEALTEGLRRGGFQVRVHPFSGGEVGKSLETAAALYDRLVAGRAERGHAVVAFGGGVAGDLGGFVAATFLRGLPLVQVPTTLLAMVDAGIGGKVAVNHREGKNLIGAFYQPRLVLADPAVLRTLPPRELTSGWAEVIKQALIRSPELLRQLEGHGAAARALDPEAATEIIARSAAIKAEVVSADEREGGLRAILNYGHTIGHAIEAVTGYGRFLHGEAVAVGMSAAVRLSHRVGLAAAALIERQDRLLAAYGLPLAASGVDAEAVLAATAIDKKVRSGRVRWVLLRDVGAPVIRDDVPLTAVRETLDEVLTP